MPQRAAKSAPTVLRQEKVEDKRISGPPAQPAAQDQLAPATAPPPAPESAPAAKSAAPAVARSREEAEPVVVGSVAAPRFQILRRGPNGDFLPPTGDLQDGDALVVRYVATQSGPIDLHNLSTNTTLITSDARVGQTLDFPFTAVRGTMNLELRPRPPVALAFAETRNSAPAAARAPASGGAARSEVAKERKAAPPPSGLRLFLTVR